MANPKGNYNPSHQKYQGDEKLRVVTQMSRVIRKRKKEQNETAGGRVATRTPKNKEDASTVESSSLITPTYAQYLAAKRTSRFCNTSMTVYCKHQNSVQLVKNGSKCFVCGEITYKRCTECNNIPIHFMDKKGTGKGKDCHMQWHNQAFFGLCFEDRKKIGIKTADWKKWTEEEYLKNSEKMAKFFKRLRP